MVEHRQRNLSSNKYEIIFLHGSYDSIQFTWQLLQARRRTLTPCKQLGGKADGVNGGEAGGEADFTNPRE